MNSSNYRSGSKQSRQPICSRSCHVCADGRVPPWLNANGAPGMDALFRQSLRATGMTFVNISA
jgi:hypothetical protein